MRLPARSASPPLDPTLAIAVRRVLAEPPRSPVDPARFSAGVLFGQPGIYPQGPPMVPAAGPPLDEAGAEGVLEADLPALVGVGAPTATGLAAFADPALAARAPDPVLRAALVFLGVTIAAPVAAAFVAGELPVGALTIGEMPGSGRVIGETGDPSVRALNARYAAEPPAVIAPSLAHDLLWSGGSDHHEEATLHAVLAMVHLQIVARLAYVAGLGTELTRRQNSLALTLLNSRHPGSDALSVRADDGPGTIPGGDPRLDGPDFWSIPFAPRADVPPEPSPLLTAVLAAVVADSDAVPRPLRYDDRLADLLARDQGRDWLPLGDHIRAALALGAVSAGPVAAAAGVSVTELFAALGLEPAGVPAAPGPQP